jgi:chemotaxis protein CheD
MSLINVGIGGYAISDSPTDTIKTYGLGSCVAVVLHDRDKNISALIHIALPDSSINLEKAEKNTGYFADTGIKLLLAEMNKQNVMRKNVSIKIVGGSNIMDKNHHFDIGKRNVLAKKTTLEISARRHCRGYRIGYQ